MKIDVLLIDVIERKVEEKMGPGRPRIQLMDDLKRGNNIKFQDLEKGAADRTCWITLSGQGGCTSQLHSVTSDNHNLVSQEVVPPSFTVSPVTTTTWCLRKLHLCILSGTASSVRPKQPTKRKLLFRHFVTRRYEGDIRRSPEFVCRGGLDSCNSVTWTELYRGESGPDGVYNRREIWQGDICANLRRAFRLLRISQCAQWPQGPTDLPLPLLDYINQSNGHKPVLKVTDSVQAGVLLHIPFCPEQVGVQTYAHPDLCDHFFLCTNGSVTVEQCENGLLFDGKGSVHKHCNYNWAVDCGARKYEDVPISSPGCLYQFGIYPESASCSTNYIKCESGVAHQTPCEPGLAYDDKTHSCNWPDLLLDTCNPEAILGFKCPTKLPSNTVAAKFWPFPRFAIPGDCGRLITCVNNFPRLISCGDSKVFDEESLTSILGFKCPTKLPSNTVAAKFWPFPRFAIPGDCGRLITCVNNFPRLISCGDSKVFDEESLTCEEPDVVPKW
uniref:Chitin-binding type-2 domain-containing protein n=1 Tax=Timema bartmani TaxID=61472 RepID=A0A7R9F8T3_9NEOP|nr:unnamed protein product [Timema bartmani]